MNPLFLHLLWLILVLLSIEDFDSSPPVEILHHSSELEIHGFLALGFAENATLDDVDVLRHKMNVGLFRLWNFEIKCFVNQKIDDQLLHIIFSDEGNDLVSDEMVTTNSLSFELFVKL